MAAAEAAAPCGGEGAAREEGERGMAAAARRAWRGDEDEEGAAACPRAARGGPSARWAARLARHAAALPCALLCTLLCAAVLVARRRAWGGAAGELELELGLLPSAAPSRAPSVALAAPPPELERAAPPPEPELELAAPTPELELASPPPELAALPASWSGRIAALTRAEAGLTAACSERLERKWEHLGALLGARSRVPVIIGGEGDSGTRAVADMFRSVLGVDMGDATPTAHDSYAFQSVYQINSCVRGAPELTWDSFRNESAVCSRHARHYVSEGLREWEEEHQRWRGGSPALGRAGKDTTARMRAGNLVPACLLYAEMMAASRSAPHALGFSRASVSDAQWWAGLEWTVSMLRAHAATLGRAGSPVGSLWGLKQPRLVGMLPFVKGALGSSFRFVMTVRDPRDTLELGSKPAGGLGGIPGGQPGGQPGGRPRGKRGAAALARLHAADEVRRHAAECVMLLGRQDSLCRNATLANAIEMRARWTVAFIDWMQNNLDTDQFIVVRIEDIVTADMGAIRRLLRWLQRSLREGDQRPPGSLSAAADSLHEFRRASIDHLGRYGGLKYEVEGRAMRNLAALERPATLAALRKLGYVTPSAARAASTWMPESHWVCDRSVC